ncbi:hypothetical protein CEXT_123251 [Caerostris extrusa]|uniref:Uncharacterized protein n=1 Tax=Caerostris extrusa TaxID=172846 RepID=A0AAV4XX84_CAEEX|nr:hypothetical protein CEXT_123251 [Caerostris extrusa]
MTRATLPEIGFRYNVIKGGKSSRGLISLSEGHHDTSARFPTHRTPLHTAGEPPTSFGKSKPIICDASLSKIRDNAIEGSLEIPLSALVPETGNSFERNRLKMHKILNGIKDAR